MENVELPPPYTSVVDVASSDVLIPPEISIENEKTKIDEEPLIAHPFADKNVRVAFIQKILLYILLQAISSAIMIFPFVYFFNGHDYSFYYYYTYNLLFFVPAIGRIIILCVYLFVIGLLLACDKARTKNPYKTIIFVAYPAMFAIFISFSSVDYTREIFVAWSCYCVAMFALLAYSIFIFQSSLEYRPDGGVFISVVVLSCLFGLTTQIDVLDKTITLCYIIAMLFDCAYVIWDIQLMTRPTYRYAVTASDIMLGVLLIRIDFIYYILTFVKKCLRIPKCWLPRRRELPAE